MSHWENLWITSLTPAHQLTHHGRFLLPHTRDNRYRGRVSRAKTPLELAALATAAVPGLNVAGLRPPQFSDENVSVTGIIDVAGNRWMVTCPHDTVGGLDMESQVSVLSRLAQAHEAGMIPFRVPRPRGFARTSDGARVMVHNDLGGRFMTEEDFSDPHVLPASLARALAHLHNLPTGIYTGVDLPSYTAAECRQRHLALLDEAASHTVIPANLWNRWEGALEDVAMWRFATAPIHGDLQCTAISVHDGAVSALSHFASAHVGDPATDIAWVLAQGSDEFMLRFREAYTMTRNAVDVHLETRAQLISELSLVHWLLHGVHAEDSDIIEQARLMIRELSEDLGDEPLVAAPLSVDTPSEEAYATWGLHSPTTDGAHQAHPTAWEDADEDGPPTMAATFLELSGEETPRTRSFPTEQ